MRIELAQHAADRGEHQVLVGDVLAVGLLRGLEQLGVEPQSIAGVIGESEEPIADEGAGDDREDEEGRRSETPGSTHSADRNTRPRRELAVRSVNDGVKGLSS